jgi:hypothetical protein
MRALIAFIFILSSTAQAARYTYFPDSQLYPGSGFDIFRPDNAFPDCVEFDELEAGNHSPSSGASDNSRVSLKLLKTREDFYQFTNFSSSMAGSYKFFSGSASYSMEQEDKFHSDSLTWAVIFETNYGIYRLKNPRLKHEYKALSAPQLKARCGNEVVLKTRKAVSVFATFTLKNLNESHRREITSKLDVSMSGALWSASMQAAYNNILQTAFSRSELELEVWAVGGRGIVSLKELVSTGSRPGESPLDLFARVPVVLENYIGSLDETQSASVEFFTGDITSLSDDSAANSDSLHAKQLSRMYLNYLDAEADYQRIRTILGVDRARYQLDNRSISSLNEMQTRLNKTMNTIEAAALKCKNPNLPCKPPSIDVPLIPWPALIVNKCERQREIAVSTGCITQEQANLARMKSEVPACWQQDIDSRYELMGWGRCQP